MTSESEMITQSPDTESDQEYSMEESGQPAAAGYPAASGSPAYPAPPSSRHAALASAVGRIRLRRGRMAVDQILLVAAAILFPLGLVFILLGWDGAAHNGHTYAQIDYLISGGIFGLGLSVAGGFMYFGYWLSRQINESRRQNALTVQALQRLEDLLDFSVNSRANGQSHFSLDAGGHSLPRGGGAAPAAGPRPTRQPGPERARDVDRPTGEMAAIDAGALYATPRGSLLHRAGCAVVARRDDLKAVEPGTDGYRYCTMCNAEVLA